MIDLTELYVEIDDFCKIIEQEMQHKMIGNKRIINGLSLSELLTILIYGHYCKYKCFKHYYLIKVLRELKGHFPKAPSYNRFIERVPEVSMLAPLYLQYKQSQFIGLGFIDATTLEVCNKKRTSNHRVFKAIASIGKSTKGWFYGLKLHVICDVMGNLVKCRLTTGNQNDLKVGYKMLEGLKGKVFGDKGYIGKKEFLDLLEKGLILVTGIRKNMKNKLLSLWDKIMLKKRSLIETIYNVMKNVFEIEHSRHRSTINAGVHIVTTLIAYILKPNKPQIKFNKQEIHLIQQLNLLK